MHGFAHSGGQATAARAVERRSGCLGGILGCLGGTMGSGCLGGILGCLGGTICVGVSWGHPQGVLEAPRHQ